VSNVIRLSSSFTQGSAEFESNVFAISPDAAVYRKGVAAYREDAAAYHQGAAAYQEDEMLEQLGRRDRLRLVQFVCSFAWADFEIQPEERVFISRLIRRLDLGVEDDLQVQQWLDRPPALDDLDPTSIPAAHRRFFVEAIEGLIQADGEIAVEERETFEIFKQLLAN